MQHLAIIMDGNKRWAEENKTDLEKAYRKGAERAEEMVIHCSDKKISFLTLYLFSQDNWLRPKGEIELLMSLLEEGLLNLSKKITSHNLKITPLGDLTMLPKKLAILVKDLTRESEKKEGLHLRIAISYSSRQEIIKAAYKIKDEISSLEEYQRLFSQALNPGNVPDPDFLIRTSGERRVSNFLLWEIAYTEFYFTKVLWPDFDLACLDLALEDFNNRKRRFGQ